MLVLINAECTDKNTKPCLEITYNCGCQSTKEMLKNCVNRGRPSGRNHVIRVIMGVEAIIDV